jgi:phosphohistidine phosphatase
MRHAKSDWGDRSISDHDRPLNQRGIHDAQRMAHWIDSIDCVPDAILCSSAKRTMQTAELMLPMWRNQPKLVVSESLYLSSPETMSHLVEDALASASRLLVIAHNPGVSLVTGHMADQSIQMPTAAVAVFANQGLEMNESNRWSLQALMRPKDLPASGDAKADFQTL